MRQLGLRVSDDFHREVRILAARLDLTLQEVQRRALERYVEEITAEWAEQDAS